MTDTITQLITPPPAGEGWRRVADIIRSNGGDGALDSTSQRIRRQLRRAVDRGELEARKWGRDMYVREVTK